jgi:hypothetical protein
MLLPAHSSAGPCFTEPRVRRASGAPQGRGQRRRDGQPWPTAQEPFIHRKKSLPGLRQKNACKLSYFTGSVGIRICRDVFQKARPQRHRAKRFSPANRLEPTPGLEPGTPSLRVKRVYCADSVISLQIVRSVRAAESVDVHRSPQRSSDVFQRCSNRGHPGSAPDALYRLPLFTAAYLTNS